MKHMKNRFISRRGFSPLTILFLLANRENGRGVQFRLLFPFVSGRKGEQKKAVHDRDDARLQNLDYQPSQQDSLKPDFIALEVKK